VAVEREGAGSVARLDLARGEVDVREMVLDDPPRIVLDLTPRAGAKATALAARPKAVEPPPAPRKEPPPRVAKDEAPKLPRVPAAVPPPPSAPAPEIAKEPPAPAPAPVAGEPLRDAAALPPTVAPAPELVAPPVAETAGPKAPELAGPPAPEPAAPPVAEPAAPPVAEAAAPPSPTAADAKQAPDPAPAAPVGPAPAREAPLELTLAAPDEPADDATAERLARAERELDALAGLPPRTKARDVAKAPREGRARDESARKTAPVAAEAEVAPRADARLPAAAAPAPAGEGDPVAAPAQRPGRAAELADDPAAQAAREARRRERQAQRAAAMARPPAAPAAPVAPGPLAFLPSPFDDPLVLSGIGALLGLIGALALVRRRAVHMEEGFTSPFDAAADLGLPEAGSATLAHEAGPASFEPVSGSPVAAPTAEMGPLFASATVVADDEEPSLFDVTAEEAGGDAVDAPPRPAAPAFQPAAPALGAASEAIDETELTEEEMRLIEELERRLAHMETRLEEVVDAKERLERHVAAQTEELRVQRAAIARTQRVLRTVVKPDDVATEPVAKT
jgi:hypothetical protein